MLQSNFRGKAAAVIPAALVLALLVACGTAATPTSTPVATKPAPTAAAPAAPSSGSTTPTAMPKPTAAAPAKPVSAKSKAVAVVATEPAYLNAVPTADAHQGIILDTISGYLGHLDRDTLAVTPSPSIKSWKRTAPDTWEYQLRPGVFFHDGEPWNASAWKTYAEFNGVTKYRSSAYNHTGPYTVEEIDPLNVRIKCGAPCPLFERALNLSRTYSPKPLREQEFDNIRVGVGVGPYKVVEWVPGQKLRTVINEKFAAVPEVPEFAAPVVQEIEWQWREETTVRTAMVMAGEADWAFLLTLEDANALGPSRFVTGGTSETAMMRIDTIFDPWLSQVKMRQALVHSIDCKAIVDSLYKGTTTCRGNVAAPGVLGITPANIAPYEYNPAKSKQLLEEIGYVCGKANAAANCGAEIKITSRGARISSNLELIESMTSYMKEAGINAKANIVETSISNTIRTCGVGSKDATIKGYKGATENKLPSSCPLAQVVEHIGFGYELFDYGKIVVRHLNCDSTQSSVCLPDKQAEWQAANGLEGAARAAALEKIATYTRDNVFFVPMFDLSAIYGFNPKLKGFENPRFDKHLFANLWWFDK
ncbi:MAG TPA: ABC transporter substrate-binding protein [Dehalococcoidia bacterium]|nr:ABC transporter substrate-binding protein [Dehalococcoidia bacterium]